MRAIVVAQNGGPEVLQLRDTELPSPAAGQARLRIHAAGVNFVDVYHRTGLYKLSLPFTPGSEGAGVVESVGQGVTEVKPGDRVAWVMEPGAYAEEANVSAWRLIPIPEGVSFEQAAAALLQGMTARFLVTETYPLKKGETALVHAAAGGVGLWLCQMGRELGARIIGTAGSAEKAALAKAHGADEVILYREQDFAAEVKRLTHGAKCHVVYDGVGASTFQQSLDSLRPRGLLASFGNASGPVPPFDVLLLAQKGSLYVTRPSLGVYASDRASTLALAQPVLEGLRRGTYRMDVVHPMPLAEAAAAHRLLESRKTTGKLVLRTP